MKCVLCLMCMLLWACGQSGPAARAAAMSSVQDSVEALHRQASAWYRGLDASMTPQAMEDARRRFLADAGEIPGYEVVLDRGGVPTDLTWSQSFWQAVANDLGEHHLGAWKRYSVANLKSIRICTGIVTPQSWSEPEVQPFVSSIMQGSGMSDPAVRSTLNRMIPLPWDGPATRLVLSLMAEFPDEAMFVQPPR